MSSLFLWRYFCKIAPRDKLNQPTCWRLKWLMITRNRNQREFIRVKDSSNGAFQFQIGVCVCVCEFGCQNFNFVMINAFELNESYCVFIYYGFIPSIDRFFRWIWQLKCFIFRCLFLVFYPFWYHFIMFSLITTVLNKF